MGHLSGSSAGWIIDDGVNRAVSNGSQISFFGIDTLTASSAADTITAENDLKIVYGRGGDDIQEPAWATPSTGHVFLYGGTGNDTLFASGAANTEVLVGDGKNDFEIRVELKNLPSLDASHFVL